MRAELATTTRLVAIALRSDALRELVYSALQASPYGEHKLHLSTFLRDGGRQILAAMAAAAGAGASQESVLATLDRLIDLEFYMPVPAHYSTWRGGTNLIVASALYDGDTPVGFDLAGRPVSGLSALNPPAVPTLVLVRTETDFRQSDVPARQECYEDCGGGGGGGGNWPPDAYRMTAWKIGGSWDNWPSGNPEFEVTIYAADASGTPIVDPATGQPAAWQCVGEGFSVTDPRYWNYDATGSYQTGSETILAATDLADPRYWRAVIHVTENDDHTCASRHFPSAVYNRDLGNDDELVGNYPIFNLPTLLDVAFGSVLAMSFTRP